MVQPQPMLEAAPWTVSGVCPQWKAEGFQGVSPSWWDQGVRLLVARHLRIDGVCGKSRSGWGTEEFSWGL